MKPIRSLAIVATAGCNLHCDYCSLQRAGTREHHWPFARRALELLLPRAAADLSVSITGGEPLTAFRRVREVVRLVTALAPRGTRVHWRLFTNGVLLSEDAVAAFLDDHGFIIRISSDGIAEAQAARGASSFGHVDSVLDSLRRDHPALYSERVEIAAVLSPRTVGYLGPSVEYWLRKGVRTVTIAPVIGPTEWRTGDIERLDAAFERAAGLSLRHYERTCQVPLSLFRKTRGDACRGPGETVCAAADPADLAVDLDGVVYGCLPASETYRQPGVEACDTRTALRVGHPEDAVFEERLNGLEQAARRTGAFDHPERRHSSYRRCADCEYVGRCRVCPLAPAPAGHDSDRVPDFLCAFNQISLAHRDRFPCQPSDYDLLSGAIPFPSLDR